MSSARSDPRISNLAWTSISLALLATVGLLDYVTGPAISLSIIYLLPISLAAWKVGLRSGLLLALTGGVVWFVADHFCNVSYSNTFIPSWNALVRLGFFVLTVVLICRTKRLTSSLEAQAASLSQQVAERQRVEESLAESQKIFRLITENVTDLITVLDADGHRIYSSPSYANCAKAVPGGDFFAGVFPEDREALRATFLDVLKTGVNHRAEYRMVYCGEALRYFESEWSAIREEQGGPRNVVVVSRDISLRKRMELLYANEKETLEMIAQGKPLQDVVQKLIDKLQTWSADLFCSILVQNEDRKALLHEGTRGVLPTATTAALTDSDDGDGQTGQRLRRENDRHLTIEAEWNRYRANAADLGLQAVYSKPVVSTLGQPLGFLSIYARELTSTEAARLQLFDKIAHVVAIALERERSQQTLRRLSNMILNAQEGERRRLARELHDSVCQILSSVGFRIESVLSRISADNQLVRQEVAKAKFLLTKAIHEVRTISENLRPSELDELGLIAALRDLCEDFKERSQLTLHLSIQSNRERFSGDTELALYRIVQEAFTNVEKHAEATEVHLELDWDESCVKLRLHDNGRGFPNPNTGPSGKRQGMGLIDMRERCAFLGGTFSMISQPQFGTEIFVRLPRRGADASLVTDEIDARRLRG